MRAILVGANLGKDSAFKKVLRELRLNPTDLRVAVDGGIEAWKSFGLEPHFAIGDWDSLKSRSLLKGLTYLTLPTRKDRSDLSYACHAAAYLGADELVCVGVTGGRADHHLASLLELSQADLPLRAPIRAIDAQAETIFLSENSPAWRRKGLRGQLVSVFALGGAARGVTLSGLEYSLRNAKLEPSSLGLSNVARGGEVRVSLKRGRLVIVLPR